MCVHVFGATSSASCSNYALRRTAKENEEVLGEVAASAHHHNFYVDNLLKSVEHLDPAKQLVKDQDLSGDLPNEKALGISWSLREDIFSFKLKLEAGALNKKNSIYDPLGFAAPFILEGRRILQGLCNQDIQWDSEVSVKKDWKNWVTKLRYIEGFHIRRYMKPDHFGKVVHDSLHHFSDASELGYGRRCSYIRIVSETGRVYCSLLL